jgi:hypothetical protein
MANTSVGRQAASSERLVREVAGSRGAAGGQQGGSRVETLTDHGRCCFVVLLGYQPLTDGICDDVLTVPSRHYVSRAGYHVYGWSAHQCRMLLGYTEQVKHQTGIF